MSCDLVDYATIVSTAMIITMGIYCFAWIVVTFLKDRRP